MIDVCGQETMELEQSVAMHVNWIGLLAKGDLIDVFTELCVESDRLFLFCQIN